MCDTFSLSHALLHVLFVFRKTGSRREAGGNDATNRKFVLSLLLHRSDHRHALTQSTPQIVTHLSDTVRDLSHVYSQRGESSRFRKHPRKDVALLLFGEPHHIPSFRSITAIRFIHCLITSL